MLLLLTQLLGQADPVEAIQAYKNQGGSHWLKPSAIAAEAIERDLWKMHYASVNDFMNHASNVAGYEINTFRRQVRSATYLKEQLGEQFLTHVAAEKAAVSAVEFLARLHSVDPKSAKKYLKPILNDTMGFLEIKKIYQTQAALLAPRDKVIRVSGQRRLMQFQAMTKRWLIEHIDLMFPAKEGFTSGRLSENASPPAYARFDFALEGASPLGEKVMDAVTCNLSGTNSVRYSLILWLQESSLLALQFNRVWIALPKPANVSESAARSVEEFIVGLERLKLDNVGVLWINEGIFPEGETPDAKAAIKRMPRLRTVSSMTPPDTTGA